MPRALIFAAAAALSLGIAAPARADTQASATLSDLQIRLVDLDPADGIAPSITFTAGTPDYAFATASTIYLQESERSSLNGAGPFGALSAMANADRTGATSSLAGDPFTGAAQLQATAFSSLGAQGQATGKACTGNFTCVPRFELSPETALYVSGIGDVSAAAGDRDFADAAIALTIDQGTPSGQNSGLRIVADAGELDPFMTHDTAPMAAQFINDTALPAFATLTLYAYASADSQRDAPPPMVPEPAGAELVGAGGLRLMAASRLRDRAARARKAR